MRQLVFLFILLFINTWVAQWQIDRREYAWAVMPFVACIALSFAIIIKLINYLLT
jgi:hypothetical protein